MFVIRRIAKWLPFGFAKRSLVDEDIEAEQGESTVQEEPAYAPKEAVGLEVVNTLDYEGHPRMITLNRQHLKALHANEEQLDEKDMMIDLLKAKNERLRICNDELNERLTTTASSISQTTESINQYRERIEIMRNMVILREAQIQQVAEDKGSLIQRLHQIINEKNKLKAQLRYAIRDVHLLNRKFKHPTMCHKEIPNSKIESNEVTAIFRADRDILMKRCEDLSVNSQAATKELNDTTNKYHQTLKHLESFTARNKFLEENMQKINTYYSRVCEERNELRRLLSETTRQDKNNTSLWSGGDNCVISKFEEITVHSSQHQCERDNSSPQLSVTPSVSERHYSSN